MIPTNKKERKKISDRNCTDNSMRAGEQKREMCLNGKLYKGGVKQLLSIDDHL